MTIMKENTYYIERKVLKCHPNGKPKEVLHRLMFNDYMICQRVSTGRMYVATLVVHSKEDRSDIPRPTNHWFSRLDLVGKGDSRHAMKEPGVVVVHLRNV